MDESLVERAGVKLPLLQSPLFAAPFRHGFTTRAGGVSQPPFETFNLGMRWGDARENVLENRRRLLAVADAGVLHVVSQVHGRDVVRVWAGDDPAATVKREADAICSDEPGLALAVFVADCVPVLFADPRCGAFAAAHAGWRGTVAGVLPATVTRLAAEFGARAGDLRVALGPCIGPCCFEVGPEVVAAFEAALPTARAAGVFIERAGQKTHIDLRLANRVLLQGSGVMAEHIDATTACTRCDPAGRFYSYRRDDGRTGQQVGFISRTITVP